MNLIVTVSFEGDEYEYEYMKEAIEQAGGHVLTSTLRD